MARTIRTWPILLVVLAAPALFALPLESGARGGTETSKCEVREAQGKWQLFVDGKPFRVQGAGLEFGNMDALAAHGANAMRTWRTNNGRRTGKQVLDDAHERGLKVMMGIEVGRERKGFDYNDEAAVARQLKRIRREVKSLKDHPALIIWGIGNELNHHATNPKVWDAVNDISKMIHELDPNHLTTTSLSGMSPEVVRQIKERAPDIDILSVQMYAEIEILPQHIANSGWDGPILVTEWGATGYWEVGKTSWGAPLENDSSTKADFYRSRYERSIATQEKQVVGSFVFLWGQKQERTPTWFGMFTEEGRETEAIDSMHLLWTGKWPENRSPRVGSMQLDGKVARDNVKLVAGRRYDAIFEVKDPDGDKLTYRWIVMAESTSNATGGDRERKPETIDGLIKVQADGRVKVKAPREKGAYRLFAYCDDTDGNTAHANIPFLVE